MLSRTLKRAKAVLTATRDLAKDTFRDRRRSARYQARRIADTASQRGEAVRKRLTQQYQRLIQTTRATVSQARRVLTVLQAETSGQADRLIQTFETFIPRVE